MKEIIIYNKIPYYILMMDGNIQGQLFKINLMDLDVFQIMVNKFIMVIFRWEKCIKEEAYSITNHLKILFKMLISGSAIKENLKMVEFQVLER